MNAARRLEAIERSLTPREAVLLWLEEARAFPDLDTYVRHQVAIGQSLTPFERMSSRVWADTKGRGRGTSEERSEKARRAIRDVAFLHGLVVTLNGRVDRLGDDARLHGSLLRYRWRDLVRDDEDLFDLEASEADSADDRRSLAWEEWRADARALVLRVRSYHGAIALLERRYLGGRSALMPSTAAGWIAARDLVQFIGQLLKSRPPHGVRPSPRSAGSNRDVDEGMRACVRELADEARISGYHAIGEPWRAKSILERQLWDPTSGAAPA